MLTRVTNEVTNYNFWVGVFLLRLIISQFPYRQFLSLSLCCWAGLVATCKLASGIAFERHVQIIKIISSELVV